MIRLKSLLSEISQDDIVTKLLEKIRNKEFERIGAGDNGIVYRILGEDYVFKITRERDEFELASVIVGRYSEFTTFIPILYVNSVENMYIMQNASDLPVRLKRQIDLFVERFTKFALDSDNEVSIFDYLDSDGARETDTQLVNFLRTLQRDVERTGITEMDLDLDFKSDNVMIFNGNIVLVDW